MKIVVLDSYTLNPGDLSWDHLKSIGDVTLYDRTITDEIIIQKRIGDAEIALTNKTPITKSIIAALPNLKYIGVLATGFNVVDIDFAKEKSIPVTNIPIYGTDSVAQLVFAHILRFCHHIKEHSDTVHEGQ